MFCCISQTSIDSLELQDDIGSKLRFGRINIARKTPFALSYDCDIFGRRPRVLLHCQAGNRGMRKSRKYSVISICRGLRGFWKKSIQIEDLPDEVLLRIFDYFSLQSILCQLSLVNRRWNKLTFSPCLWSKLQININVDSGLVETSINPILAKFESGLRTLSLWLRYPSQSGAVISALPQLPKLIKLDFNDTEQLTPANVTLLTQKFPSVRAANFSHCFDLKDAGLLILAKNWSNLRHLNIAGCFEISDAGLIDFFNEVERIESLNLAGYHWLEISDRAVRILAERHGRSLRSIWLCGSILTDLSIANLANEAPLITDFSINSAHKLTDSAIDHLERFRHLRNLHLKSFHNLSEGRLAAMFPHFPQLSCLSLQHCDKAVTDFVLDKISTNCAMLRCLKIGGNRKVTDIGLNLIVKNCRHLVVLSLTDLDLITGEIFNSVPHKNLPNLKYLDVSGCKKLLKQTPKLRVGNQEFLALLQFTGGIISELKDTQLEDRKIRLRRHCRSLMQTFFASYDPQLFDSQELP